MYKIKSINTNVELEKSNLQTTNYKTSNTTSLSNIKAIEKVEEVNLESKNYNPYVKHTEKTFTVDDNYCSYIMQDGRITETYYWGENLYINSIDPDNIICKRYNPDTGEYTNVSIFDEQNSVFGQYGAAQTEFKKNRTELLKDEYIINALNNYYPISSFETVDDAMDFYERYLSVLSDTGCGYAAAVNIIFKEYEGREEEFKKTFGYSMYKVGDGGVVDYNYEYMMLDYFNYDWAGKYSIEQYEKGSHFLTNVQEWFSNGVSTQANLKTFPSFLKEKYNIDVNRKNNISQNFAFYSESSNSFEKYSKKYFDNNDYTILASDYYSLYNINGTLYSSGNIGNGHYMLVTGITEDGKTVVSSWGRKFIVDNGSSFMKHNFFETFNF